VTLIMRFFEDIRVGERSEIGSHTFKADAMIVFAKKFDPQPFHVSEKAAARSHFGKLAASGWYTSAVCMRHIVDANRREDDARRTRGEPIAKSGPSPGVRDVRWLKPVYAGDTVSFASEIVEARASSRPGYGLIVTKSTGINQHGDLVYSVQGAVFVERRPG
jgi:acyl dehydratase